jgi:excisionase family DNA binding protein
MRDKPQVEDSSPDSREYVGAAKVASVYDVSSRHILNLAAAGTIPSIRVGKKSVRFNLNDVKKAMEAR